MSSTPTFNFYRVLPRESEFLQRRAGNRGEIFYDSDNQTLRIYNGVKQGGFSLTSEENIAAQLVAIEKATVKYTVTITGPQGQDTGNKYNLNGVYVPRLNFVIGYTYVFNQDDPSNEFFPNQPGTTANTHQINFSADNPNGSLGGGTRYVTNVRYRLDGQDVSADDYNGLRFNTATSREVWITVTKDTPSILYYYCKNHLNMGNTVDVSEPGSGGGGGTTVTVSDTLPQAPISGNLWFNTTNGKLYVYIDDGTSSQWAQPSVPQPILTNYATITYVDSAINAVVEEGITVAADDSTKFLIRLANGIQFVGANGITTSADSDGVITITGGGTTGDITFDGTTIDSSDSSAITFTPLVNFESDVIVENSLEVQNEIQAKTIVVSERLEATEVVTTSAGTPTLVSETNLNLTAENAVVITRSPLRMASFTTTERNALIVQNGDIIYNTTTNQFQGYANNTWVNL